MVTRGFACYLLICDRLCVNVLYHVCNTYSILIISFPLFLTDRKSEEKHSDTFPDAKDLRSNSTCHTKGQILREMPGNEWLVSFLEFKIIWEWFLYWLVDIGFVHVTPHKSTSCIVECWFHFLCVEHTWATIISHLSINSRTFRTVTSFWRV